VTTSTPIITPLPVADFAEQAGRVLAADPVRCSVIATLLAQHRDRPRPEDTWILIADDTGPVGAALATRERNVLITPLPPEAGRTATVQLADLLHERRITLRSVAAQNGDTANFARAWHDVTGAVLGPEHAEGLYDISAPPAMPDGVGGSARTARESDVPGLAVWMAEFLAEIHDDAGTGGPEEMVRRRMRHGWKFVWEDGGELVSMAGVTKPAGRVSRVGAVYTPPRFRGHGYASAVTAAATRQGFADGAGAVMLYTDLSNPTSNKIYQALGYRRVGDASVITFS
jgi:GNAT superfamily N-acetyltransferase